MNVYVDSSVLLRVVLGEPHRLRAWPSITRALSSELRRIECLRTLDRARVRGGMADAIVCERRAAVLEHLGVFDLIRLEPRLLERAAESFPTPLGALHLASALLAKHGVPDLVLATHDAQLATAARSVGFEVLGSPRRV